MFSMLIINSLIFFQADIWKCSYMVFAITMLYAVFMLCDLCYYYVVSYINTV